ncbi:MAG TPA: hypothetical protein VF625_16020 [Longimicrobium sp.]|jgi:hypothetical protein
MLLREDPSLRWKSFARLCLVVIALGAVAACGGAGQEARTSFVDPFGETPDSTWIGSGSGVKLVYTDYPVHEFTPAKQQDRAHEIARSAWKEIGAAHSVDTVRVTFSDKHRGLRSWEQHTSSYLFYPDQLKTEARP